MIRGIPGGSVVSCGREAGNNADDKIPACRYVPGLVSDVCMFSSRMNEHQEIPAARRDAAGFSGFIMRFFSRT